MATHKFVSLQFLFFKTIVFPGIGELVLKFVNYFQLRLMLNKNKKMEIQCLDTFSRRYLTEVYLPYRLRKLGYSVRPEWWVEIALYCYGDSWMYIFFSFIVINIVVLLFYVHK